MSNLISVKFDWPDITQAHIDTLTEKINKFIGPRESLSNSRTAGKYLYFDYNFTLPASGEQFVQGLVTGYLIAKGYELI